MELMKVSLDDIDLEDDAFRVRTNGPGERSPTVIRRAAGIDPPLIVPRSNGEGYRVIAGHEKIAALRALGSKTIPARVLEPGAFGPVDLMEIAIHESRGQGSFNPVDVSRTLNRLKKMGVADSELAERFLPAMGCVGDRSTLQCYLALVDLPGDIAGALSLGRVTLDAVERVKRRLDGEDAWCLLRLIRDLRLGVNLQREVIALLREISIRDDLPVPCILERDEIASIIRDEGPNLPQRVRRLVSALRRLRAPETMRFLDEVKKRVRDLNVDPAVTLEFSRYLEEKRMRVSFTFRSPDEYRKILENLEALGEDGTVDGLVEDLFGRRGREADAEEQK